MTDDEIDILVEELAEDVDCDFCRKMGWYDECTASDPTSAVSCKEFLKLKLYEKLRK